MRTIFNTYVELKSKAMYNRLAKAVKNKGFEIYSKNGYNGFENSFHFTADVNSFDCWQIRRGQEVTEKEFLELLKEYKP